MTLQRIDHLAIVGAGSVATALSRAAAAAGIGVEHWVRNPASVEVPNGAPVAALARVQPQIATVVLAVPFAVAAQVASDLPLGAGSVVIDVTNPFGRPLPEGFASGAEWIAEHVPDGVHLVKAFNVLGAESMTQPTRAAGQALLPVAGDDVAAREAVAGLARRLGFDVVDVGGLASSAAILEEAARYWGLLALAAGLGRRMVLLADRGEQRG